jgi:hypothetical protein
MSERSAQKKAPVSGAICLGVYLTRSRFTSGITSAGNPSLQNRPGQPSALLVERVSRQKDSAIGNRRPVKIL